MKKISLNTVIEEQLQQDASFAEHFAKELLINEIAKMVVTLRKRTHLTQAELAEKANTTQPVIARLESGMDTRMPSLTLLARIAMAANTTLHISFDRQK